VDFWFRFLNAKVGDKLSIRAPSTRSSRIAEGAFIFESFSADFCYIEKVSLASNELERKDRAKKEKMAVPTKFAQRPGRDPSEDCRDFLRTGRCKYGASCKYNHPPNVQSGGGIKAPVDSSEPQFPVRPGELTCQYYMKHGTCKFGQACKFHHPPQSEMTAALMAGGTVVMNVGRNMKGGSEQIVMNSNGSSAMALQFLPQRPDEPDCIYFLRNGRCKYGATCRYHHPVSFHQGKPSDVHGTEVRRQQQRPDDSVGGMNDPARSNSAGRVPESVQSSSSQYITSQQLSSSYGQQVRQRDPGSSGGAPTHFIVTETPLAVMPGNASGSYHRMVVGEEYSVPLNTTGRTGLAPGRDFTSSSSSIASSYETATDMLPSSVQQGDQNTVMWPRPVRRTASGGSLSAYDSTPPLRPQVPHTPYGSRSSLVPSVSDNSIASRGIRTESIGSASDSSAAYQDAWNSSSHSQLTSGRGWVETSSSYEQGHRPRNPHFDRFERKMPQDSRYAQSSMQGRDPRSIADTESPDYGGLSMMTSALLNMLDTPEEAAMKSYATGESSLRSQLASPPLTPRNGHATYSQALGEPPHDRYLNAPSTSRETSRHYFMSNEYSYDVTPEYNYMREPISSFPPALTYSRSEPPRNNTGNNQNGPSPPWSPERPSRAPGAPHPSSDIGLYLP
jgi:translation initiation factor 4G